MRIRLKLLFLFFILVFLCPAAVFAAQNKLIFGSEIFADPNYANSANAWQIFNNQDEGLYPKKDGFLLRSDGDAYLLYSGMNFSYKDYDRLAMEISANQPLKISVIPNLIQENSGSYTYELIKIIPASREVKRYEFSLKKPSFARPVENFGLRLQSDKPAEVVIKRIVLEKMNFFETLEQGFKDYFTVAPYSSYSVNLLPTPQIFGRPALLYFLPLIFLLLCLLFYVNKYRKIAFFAILAVWIIIDARMFYEYVSYARTDYNTYVKPPAEEKSLRNFGNFYQFAAWLQEKLPPGAKQINFYAQKQSYFPRLLQYLIYPIKVDYYSRKSDIFVIYDDSNIIFNPEESRLYQNNQPISPAGRILAKFGDHSFIFQAYGD